MTTKKQLFYAILPHILKAVIAIGIAIAIISIASERITKIEVTLNEKKAMALALQHRSETTTLLRNIFATIGDSDKKILNSFPTTDNVLEFVTAVETIGNQNSMQQSLRFGTPESPISTTPAVTIVPVGYTVTTNGTIMTLANYIRQFQELSYFASIRSMTIATGAAKGWEDNSTITIQGTLYTKNSL